MYMYMCMSMYVHIYRCQDPHVVQAAVTASDNNTHESVGAGGGREPEQPKCSQSSEALPVSVKKHSFDGRLCPAVWQQKLLSSP